jgi:hypothetical protein
MKTPGTFGVGPVVTVALVGSSGKERALRNWLQAADRVSPSVAMGVDRGSEATIIGTKLSLLGYTHGHNNWCQGKQFMYSVLLDW